MNSDLFGSIASNALLGASGFPRFAPTPKPTTYAQTRRYTEQDPESLRLDFAMDDRPRDELYQRLHPTPIRHPDPEEFAPRLDYKAPRIEVLKPHLAALADVAALGRSTQNKGQEASLDVALSEGLSSTDLYRKKTLDDLRLKQQSLYDAAVGVDRSGSRDLARQAYGVVDPAAPGAREVRGPTSFDTTISALGMLLGGGGGRFDADVAAVPYANSVARSIEEEKRAWQSYEIGLKNADDQRRTLTGLARLQADGEDDQARRYDGQARGLTGQIDTLQRSIDSDAQRAYAGIARASSLAQGRALADQTQSLTGQTITDEEVASLVQGGEGVRRVASDYNSAMARRFSQRGDLTTDEEAQLVGQRKALIAQGVPEAYLQAVPLEATERAKQNDEINRRAVAMAAERTRQFEVRMKRQATAEERRYILDRQRLELLQQQFGLAQRRQEWSETMGTDLMGYRDQSLQMGWNRDGRQTEALGLQVQKAEAQVGQSGQELVKKDPEYRSALSAYNAAQSAVTKAIADGDAQKIAAAKAAKQNAEVRIEKVRARYGILLNGDGTLSGGEAPPSSRGLGVVRPKAEAGRARSFGSRDGRFAMLGSGWRFGRGRLSVRGRARGDKLPVGLLGDLADAAEALGYDLNLGTASTGHSINARSGNRSRHTDHLAVDVPMINGIPVSDKRARPLVAQVKRFLEARGYSWNSESGHDRAVLGYGFPGHDDHLHISRRA